MSQNILLLIRADIKALDDKVTALQQSVDDVKANLPDVTEINEKLDAQTQALDAISTTVSEINNTLNPDIPDLPLSKTAQNKKNKRLH
ncbi:P10 [Trabala vishnou gigantina nucleopolyhedrovirus]|uniref:P10 n=1 Tax=Trabala vishnou gigantina nucleopolyhedrovirus TaxID=2863583 RepID=UPI002481A24C|nr:P10 [Trabala vishnou gigantina nucleopolyhedrovirus]QYC92780.1 P10 [Trabala vishnou gigantina nucleopolyhedrovirus]